MPPIDGLDFEAADRAGVTASAGSELLADLNPPQREAVLHEDGPLLILAGAGSGKTRVITHRIAWLVRERGVSPGAILAITFTNKAAREMKERVEKLVPEIHGLWIGTFHAMCARLLRREIEVLGGWTRDFTIYDTHDRTQLLKELIQQAGYDPTRFRPAEVGAWISDWKNAWEPPFEGEIDEPVKLYGIEEEVFKTVRDLYGDTLRKRNALDFDDLLVAVLELFQQQPGLRDLYAERFRHVLVDEYQDTNGVQYQLVRAFASRHGNLAVCGDPDQSIYAWRGADIGNILDFERDFGEGPESVKVIKLEQNYRSTEVILRAAQGLIEHNVARKPKGLWTERKGGELVSVRECVDENEEADEIAAAILGLREAGFALEQVAVLHRVNSMQRALERGLALAGVAYRVVGGVEFYKRREVRDLLSWLQVLVNPSDDMACVRALAAPARGVGEKSLQTLSQWAKDRRLSLAQAAASAEARALVRGKGRQGLEEFARLVAELRPLREGPATSAAERVIAAVGYWEHVAQLSELDKISREENVHELLGYAEAYDRDRPEGGLKGFLQDVALVSDVDGARGEPGGVTLMTLHSAKGLEFPVVIVAGLEEELLPHARSIQQGPAGEEEERRLLYVGMTRAKERLILTLARTRNSYAGPVSRQPSRFLAEIPPELILGYEPAETRRVVRDEDAWIEEPAESFRVGDQVEHDHFGRGRVESLHGSGAGAKASVCFARHGLKQLLLSYAPLRVVGRATGGGA